MTDIAGAKGAADELQSDDQSQNAQSGNGAAGDVAGLLKKRDQLLGENKKLKAELAELRSLVERSNQEKLEAEGKKDELIQKLKGETEELKKKFLGSHSAFASRVITGELKAEAAKHGCIALDDFVRLVDINALEVDENYQPDPEQIKALVQDALKSKPYLFSKSAPQINARLPGGGQVPAESKPDLSKMSASELRELAHQLARSKSKGA